MAKAKATTFKGVEQVLTTKTEKSRFSKLLSLAKEFYPEPVEDAFVSQYRESDGRLVVESIWFFTASWFIEFKKPMQEEHFDLAPLKQSVTWLVVEARDFDLKKTSPSSRMKVTVKLASGVGGHFQATDSNCTELLRLTKSRLLPNVMTSVPSLVSDDLV